MLIVVIGLLAFLPAECDMMPVLGSPRVLLEE